MVCSEHIFVESGHRCQRERILHHRCQRSCRGWESLINYKSILSTSLKIISSHRCCNVIHWRVKSKYGSPLLASASFFHGLVEFRYRHFCFPWTGWVCHWSWRFSSCFPRTGWADCIWNFLPKARCMLFLELNTYMISIWTQGVFCFYNFVDFLRKRKLKRGYLSNDCFCFFNFTAKTGARARFLSQKQKNTLNDEMMARLIKPLL